ncbi:hypothetical protein IFM89_004846 [Coptis chinensis]|uniref:Pentatricopeptide repeat-containing protein n=1 Tax=Coptis chinensis TaxID=261450 RepID=A0A835H4I8_9MAGN|nr:hypothetical protein IFM89_004846 [Coptis chinensis]
MPINPNSIVWGALLGGCRVHKDADLAEMATKCLLELEPENGAIYVLVSNTLIYMQLATNGMTSVAYKKLMMMDKGIKKTPGCSSIEMSGAIHKFVAGDRPFSLCARYIRGVSRFRGGGKRECTLPT